MPDSEKLNFFLENEREDFSIYTTPDVTSSPPSFTEIVTIFSTSSPLSAAKDPASHDKIYFDDRFNASVFDPFLARNSLPKILISIIGMLLTGFFLNLIIVSARTDID